ncbi:unnamed protein product [Thlaspi arvense]|uniref:peroxidase n=1 Tax=Thlaspi arvense TaxID=13288 RepID=A0AAU9T3H6_THLAR|nr:unnamed protein product [Thlaspi arvense]
MAIVSSCFVLAISVYVALYGLEFDNGILRRFQIEFEDPKVNRTGQKFSEESPMSMRVTIPRSTMDHSSSVLKDDFYRHSCPSAQRLIRKEIRRIYHARPSIAPSLIRLLFHDCFIEGCDASVLLDTDESQTSSKLVEFFLVLLDSDGSITSEKEAAPNLSLKGFDVIDTIKSILENVCPGVVSCADIIVLAARESVKVAGGPRYHLKTGRKDSLLAFKDKAELQLPSPHANLSEILASFYSRGFTTREMVCLSGAHSIGITHCTFFEDRLYNFSGTGKPDPELNTGFLQELKTKCPFSGSAASPSPSPCPGLAASLPASHSLSSGKKNATGVIDLSFNNEGGEAEFGVRYYKRLMQKKGVLFSDHQLMGSEESLRWVRAYASDPQLFRQDFVSSMAKLSSHGVLTGALGEVRRSCSKSSLKKEHTEGN